MEKKVAPVRAKARNDMEIFKDVVGYNGRYMVSNLGRVKSLKRTAKKGNGTRMVRERIMKPSIAPEGRHGLALSVSGKTRRYRVHQLVASAFIGPCPPGHHCCHNDGNPGNNALYNLRYDTPKGNHADKILHGTHARGERVNKSKLTEAQVLAIRADTRTQKVIAADYGIARANVSLIRHRKRWAWL
jgi:hypothetical protein